MSNRRVRVVVLCEGVSDFRFAYRCLVECGWRPDQIAPNISPPGRRSAYDHVLEAYPIEVRANRKGGGQRDLLVLIDGDNQRRDGRHKQLEQRLRKGREHARRDDERIAIWVPTRQLETWVYFMKHGVADEETEYKRSSLVRDGDRLPAARKFARMLKRRQSLPSGVIPSLEAAVEEFKRIQAAPVKQRPVRRTRKGQ